MLLLFNHWKEQKSKTYNASMPKRREHECLGSVWEHSAELQITCIKLTSIDANSIISWPNPMFDLLLESSRWDDTNKRPNIGFGQEMGILGIKIRTLSGALTV